MRSGFNAPVRLFDCQDGSFNISNLFFGGVGVQNYIIHQIIYGIVKLNVYEEILY